jgi:Caspase domain
MRIFDRIVISLTLVLVLFAAPALAETRVALVIGNGAYVHSANLPNPPNDAADVTATLKNSQFDVIGGSNLSQSEMQDLTIRFARMARDADVALFYYSGHAMQFNGVNYLMPIDAELKDEADLKRFTRVDDILEDLQQAKNLHILVLDSCRDNPLADALKRSIGQTRSATIRQGLVKMEAPVGTIISFSTQAGKTADDGHGRNSPYTTSFIKRIGERNEIGSIFREVSSDVYESSGKQQLPELSLSIIGNFYLNGPVSVTVAPSQGSADPCASAETHWKAATSVGSLAAYQDHVARFPSCAFAGLARAKIDELKTAAIIPPVRSQDIGTPHKFDGTWDITVGCPSDGKALGYSRTLTGTITNGRLHGEVLQEGTAGWLAINGPVEESGKAVLTVRGLTNDPKFTFNRAKAGSAYSYTVNAQFDASTGAGKRVELRPCTVNFSRR